MHKLVLSTIGVIILLALWSCANQTTPTGGPMDTIPPILIKSKPEHKQKNYTDKTIELTFNEFVNLNNPNNEILVSPALTEDLEFKVKKNTVHIINPKDWEENTTYTLSFREGIRDITENNSPRNLRLAFSTGPTIDSLSIFGRIRLVLKESIPENITIALYKTDTFNIFEHKPSYITVSNKNGSFSLENIKAGSYYAYAYEDKNKNLTVESRTEKFGFLKDPIQLYDRQDSITIPLVNLDMRQLSINNIRNNGLYTQIKFNKNIINYNISTSDATKFINSFGGDQTEVVFYNPKPIKDSLRIHFTATDSIESLVDTTFYIASKEPTFIPANFSVKATRPNYNLNYNLISQSYQLSKPLQTIIYDSVFIQIDSTESIVSTPEDFSYDSTQKKLTFKKNILRDTLFKVKDFKVEIILAPSAFISVEADSSAFQKQQIAPVNKAQTGTLLIETKTEVPHYIIQLFNSTGDLIEELTNEAKHTYNFLPPQNYKIRVIIDRNNNGKWDPGNFFKHEEPEQIWIYQTADKKFDFPIRANWELGPIMLIF